MKKIGKLFSEILAVSGLATAAEYAATITNAGRIIVADVFAACASGEIVRQGPRALALDTPPSLAFEPTGKSAIEAKDNEGKSVNRYISGLCQFAHRDNATSVNYAPTMPSHAMFNATGNAYAKAYLPKDDGKTQNADGYAHHATTPAYQPLVPVQHATFAHAMRQKGPFTLADVLATTLAKCGAADSEGRATLKNADSCVRDSLNDLVKFGFLLANVADSALDTVYLPNMALIEARKAAKASKA